MKRSSTTTILSGVALALALAASLWIALRPDFYQGVSVTIPLSETSPLEPIRMSASFIEMEGLWGVFVLVIPVVLTLLGFFASRVVSYHRIRGRLALWTLALLLLFLSILGAFSIGLFYVPSALALLAAAMLSLRSRSGDSY